MRVRCYVPIDHHGLSDRPPDRSRGEIAVVERPVAVASVDVGLADHDKHGEARMLRRQEADERSPDILRVLAIDGNLRRARLARLVQLEALDPPKGPARAVLYDRLHHRGHLGGGFGSDHLALWLEQERGVPRADTLTDVGRGIFTAVSHTLDDCPPRARVCVQTLS